MSDPVTWAVIGGLALAGAGTGYQINAANEQADKANSAADAQRKAQDQLLSDQTAQQKSMEDQQAKQNQQAQNNALVALAATRKRSLAAGAGGRSDTILTSPLGITTSAPTYGKTLLGA